MADTQNRSVVGVHYRVGRKIGEGSFGVIFEGVYSLHHPVSTCFDSVEGTNLLNSQTVAIKFVRVHCSLPPTQLS